VFFNQDLNQASTNSTVSFDSSNPSYYESVLRSRSSNGPLTADDYLQTEEFPVFSLKGANSQKNKQNKVAATFFQKAEVRSFSDISEF
jgi:hypothetical protein